jgi:predicted MFS family arabinose efflux permease
MPTVPLVSALCFRHLPDPDGQFGKVRVWGTVGWMIGGLTLSLWLERDAVFHWLSATHPNWNITQVLQDFFRTLPHPKSSDCFRMSAVLSFALSSFCIFLPHTPPAAKPQGQIAPLAVLAMFRDRTFTIFIAISCLLAVLVVPLYNMAVPPLLTELGVPGNWVPAVMLIGQVSEFPALLMLSVMLRRIGPKAVFALGIAAWALRYGLFAVGSPWPLVMTGLALHGVCHVFLIIVGQLYLDAKCSPDLRATAQNLLSFVTLGIGLPLGTLLGGVLRETFQDSPAKLFAAPAVAAIVLLIVFWKTIRFPATLRAPVEKAEINPSGDAVPS